MAGEALRSQGAGKVAYALAAWLGVEIGYSLITREISPITDIVATIAAAVEYRRAQVPEARPQLVSENRGGE